MSRPGTPDRGGFALSDVLGPLSYALDITEGEPPGHAVRTLSIGMRLAEQLRLGDDVRSALFYALLLKDAGCSSNASRLSSLFGADDQAAKHALKRVDWSRSASLAAYTWRAIELEAALAGEPGFTATVAHATGPLGALGRPARRAV